VFCGLGSATGNSRSGPRVGLILLLLITTCYAVSAGGGDLDLEIPSRDGRSMWADSTEKKDPGAGASSPGALTAADAAAVPPPAAAARARARCCSDGGAGSFAGAAGAGSAATTGAAGATTASVLSEMDPPGKKSSFDPPTRSSSLSVTSGATPERFASVRSILHISVIVSVCLVSYCLSLRDPAYM